MLKKACVADLKSRHVVREMGHIAVVMRHYPRGLSKLLIDEYVNALAPQPELLKDFLAQKRKLDGNHNAAFQTVDYEKRFRLAEDGVEHLRRLAEMSSGRDVYLLCQCAMDQRCHRELLLIAARRWFDAKTELRAFSYPAFEARLPEQPAPLL